MSSGLVHRIRLAGERQSSRSFFEAKSKPRPVFRKLRARQERGTLEFELVPAVAFVSTAVLRVAMRS